MYSFAWVTFQVVCHCFLYILHFTRAVFITLLLIYFTYYNTIRFFLPRNDSEMQFMKDSHITSQGNCYDLPICRLTLVKKDGKCEKKTFLNF